MRRKTNRTSEKATPEKTPKEDSSAKSRRARRRRRSPSKSSDSEDEEIVAKDSSNISETPDTTAKGDSPSDQEASGEGTWHVTPSEEKPKGEVQKIRISLLAKPSRDSLEKSSKLLRHSRSSSHTEDDDQKVQAEEDVDEKSRGKGKSKGKHRSKIEKFAPESEQQMTNDISENAQVTPLSPSIDKPVDKDETVSQFNNSGESFEPQNDNDLNISTPVDNAQNTEYGARKELAEEEQLNSSSAKNIVNEAESKPDNHEQTSSNAEHEADPSTVEDASSKDTSTADTSVENSSIKDASTAEVSTEDNTSAEPASLPRMQGGEPEAEDTRENGESHTPPRRPRASQDSKEITSSKIEQPKPHPKPPRKKLKRDAFYTEVPQVSSEPPEEAAPTAATAEPASTSDSNDGEPSKSSEQEEQQQQQQQQLQIPRPPRRTAWRIKDDMFSSMVKVDLEALKTICPGIEFPEQPDMEAPSAASHTPPERRRASTSNTTPAEPIRLERKVSLDFNKSQDSVSTTTATTLEHQVSTESSSSTGGGVTQDSVANNSSGGDSAAKANIIAFNRKISIVDDTASKMRPPPSPAKNPVSEVLFITNLVRPFTLKQLKELLERTGKIKAEGFWTDRIKSKCYVQYESSEEAEATRNALHGVQWPIGNGKKLMIDFATPEALEKAKNPPAPPQPATPPPKETRPIVRENLVPPAEPKPRQINENIRDGREKRTDAPVREWDIGKKELHRGADRSVSGDRDRMRKHRRSPSITNDFISKKQRKEVPPQKMMDDLFLKTKATPSIYWQPLTPEEISTKQQQRLMRMEEHKRRMEEGSRGVRPREGARGGGGGGLGGGLGGGASFRRRYD